MLLKGTHVITNNCAYWDNIKEYSQRIRFVYDDNSVRIHDDTTDWEYAALVTGDIHYDEYSVFPDDENDYYYYDCGDDYDHSDSGRDNDDRVCNG